MTSIPRRLGHIWIGPKPAPTVWMQSWPEKHPDWSYTVFGNETLTGYPFRLRKLINEYVARGAWAGAQDMMRYELLHAFGGFMADADAICLHPVDELLHGASAFTVYDRPETDPFRGVCPILACAPGDPFVGAVIDRLATLEPWELRKPEVSTGNRFLMRMIRELAPGPEALHIWPTHYFIPWQKSAPDVWYDGPDTIYAEQKWGTSTWAYNREATAGEQLSGERLAERLGTIHRSLTRTAGTVHAPAAAVTKRQQAATEATARVPALLAGPELRHDFEALGHAINAAMTDAGFPMRPHGAFFFRHMQNDSITSGRLRSRSDTVRRTLLGWMATARNALLIGFDTGHLALSALHLAPELRITAIDAGRWRVEKDPDPPRRDTYLPPAADWLMQRFPDRVRAVMADEAEALAEIGVTAPGDDRFDLVLFAEPDIRALRSYAALRPMLSDDALVISAEPEAAGAQDFLTRLLLQGLVCQPIVSDSFGPGRGSLAVTMPRP
ncbi:glycosyltransferase family 32 protein [Paenirhodobacter enshiensis]|uniref:glycosyltransferase family 32 protein n=1 Tax=Paenirhodobacter enshiensis TaxID=1105367 RepID=UPI000689B7F3|nr:glycosyltransferase [Paenirhodobacter enshiensis]